MHYFIALAFFSQMFSLDPNLSGILQPLSILPILLAAGWTLFSQSAVKSKIQWGLPALIIFIILPIQSALVTLIRGEINSILYSLTYLFVSLCTLTYCRSITFANISNAYAIAIGAFSVCIILFDTTSITTAMLAGSDIGIYRLSSFENHPNLLGHVFALNIIICVFSISKTRTIKLKVLLSSSLVISTTLLVLTSSRGALLSLLVAISATWIAINLKLRRTDLIIKSVLGGLIAMTIITLSSEKALIFLSEILDVESKHRGMDSGLSGRTDNWTGVIEIVFSDPTILLFGKGMRTWSDDFFGFATDSSYVNFLYEYGLFTTIAITASITFFLRKAYSTLSEIDNVIPFATLSFIIIESLVARYMLGIGNPGSLLILFCLGHFSMKRPS